MGEAGALGEEEDGVAPASPLPAAPPPMEGHVGDDPCEFFVRPRRPPRRRLCLPTPFAREMELDPPESLWLHMRGCGISGTRVRVDFPAPHVMYLHRGWKTFAHIDLLTEGLTLHFKLMEGGLLSVKVFGLFGTHARCCVESSSDSEDSSSGRSDEEDSGSDDKGSRRQDDGSD